MAMGRRQNIHKDPLAYLLHTWRQEQGLDADLQEYLIGMATEDLRQADEADEDLAGRLLGADILRLHRCSVEEQSGGLVRARLVSAEVNATSRRHRRRSAVHGRLDGGVGPARRSARQEFPNTSGPDDQEADGA